MRTRMLQAVVGAGALLVLAGCEEPAPPAPDLPILVKRTAAESEGPAALAKGQLILRDGCLALEHPDRSRTLLLWPAEARLERPAGGKLRVVGTGGAQRTVQLGEEIAVGGAELGTGAGDSALVGPGRQIAATQAFPAACTGKVWSVYSFEPLPPGSDETGLGVTDAASLQGKWVVAQIHGANAPAGTHVIDVTVTGANIHAQSQCVPFRWTFTLAAGKLRTTEAPNPEPVCERKLSYWEDAFRAAFGRASSINRQDDGSLLVRGPGGQVLLRRP